MFARLGAQGEQPFLNTVKLIRIRTETFDRRVKRAARFGGFIERRVKPRRRRRERIVLFLKKRRGPFNPPQRARQFCVKSALAERRHGRVQVFGDLVRSHQLGPALRKHSFFIRLRIKS